MYQVYGLSLILSPVSSSSPWNSAVDARCFLLILLTDGFSRRRELRPGNGQKPVNEDDCREKFSLPPGISISGAPISCHLKPNDMVILIKHDNYTPSVFFLCKYSSFLPLYRTSGALPKRLDALRSAEAASPAHGQFCSPASPFGATDCQPLKTALLPRSSSGCRQR
jgi:hypothetical protein